MDTVITPPTCTIPTEQFHPEYCAGEGNWDDVNGGEVDCGPHCRYHENHVPNPGSPEAKQLGCLCPVMDNGHGKGYMGGMKDPDTGETIFVKVVGCPLHYPEDTDY